MFQTEWNSQNPEIPVKRIFVFTGIIFQTEAGKMQKPCHPYYAVRVALRRHLPLRPVSDRDKKDNKKGQNQNGQYDEQDNAQYF